MSPKKRKNEEDAEIDHCRTIGLHQTDETQYSMGMPLNAVESDAIANFVVLSLCLHENDL